MNEAEKKKRRKNWKSICFVFTFFFIFFFFWFDFYVKLIEKQCVWFFLPSFTLPFLSFSSLFSDLFLSFFFIKVKPFHCKNNLICMKKRVREKWGRDEKRERERKKKEAVIWEIIISRGIVLKNWNCKRMQ